MTRHGALAALEGGERRADFCDGLLFALRVDDDHIRRIPDRDAIVLQVHQPRRAGGQHREGFGDALGVADLQHIGMQVRHADERAIAERRERIEDIVGRDRAIAGVFHKQIGVDQPAPHVVGLVAPHQEQVGGRQDGDRDTRFGETLRDLRLALRIERREFGGVADRDAAAESVLFGEVTNQRGVEIVRRVAEVEMHVDIDVVFARQLEHAADLAGAIGVIAGRSADDLCAAPQAIDHQLLGAGIVGQAFLRKYAQLDVDRPFIFVNQRLHAFKTAHADAGIDLHMGPHARRAMRDAVLQRLACAGVNVLYRECLLGGGDTLDGVRAALDLGRAAIDDARLVEMNMRLDQPAAAQASRGVIGWRIANEIRL